MLCADPASLAHHRAMRAVAVLAWLAAPAAARAAGPVLNVTFTPVAGQADTYLIEGTASATGVTAGDQAQLSVHYDAIRPGESFPPLPDNMNRSCSGGRAQGDRCLTQPDRRVLVASAPVTGGAASLTICEQVYLGARTDPPTGEIPAASEIRIIAQLGVETPDDPQAYRRFSYAPIHGPVRLPLARDTAPPAQPACPPCPGCGMAYQDTYTSSFHETDPSSPGWDEIGCVYGTLGPGDGSVGSGAFNLRTYTSDALARTTWYTEVEAEKDHLDRYGSGSEVRVIPLETSSFDVYRYRLEYFGAGRTVRYHEIVAIHLLGQHKLRVVTQYHPRESDATKAFDALEKCALAMVPGGWENHAPALTVRFVGYTPGPRGQLGTLQFEATAKDADRDPLRLRFHGHKGELRQDQGQISTEGEQRDDTLVLRITMPAPPLASGLLLAKVYDGRGGTAWTGCSWALPPGTGVSNLDLPSGPWAEPIAGPVTVNGRDLTGGELLELEPGDVLVTPAIDPATGEGGGYAAINFPGGTVQIGPNSRVRFVGPKDLTLVRGQIRLVGEDRIRRTPSGRRITESTPPEINIAPPTTPEDHIESIEDPALRAWWREEWKRRQSMPPSAAPGAP